METSPIYGILIEGVDFVGKTTVAEALSAALARDGIAASSGKCYLHRHPLIEFLEERARETESMAQRDWYYSSALLLDLFAYFPLDSFRVQDRHWLTQVGRNRFFHPDVKFMAEETIERRHFPFQWNVLLVSSLEAKLVRACSRQPNSPRDRYLAANPGLHQEYERFLVGLVPSDETWTILDTTELTIDEVVLRIREFTGI